ncbi:MAG TPA: type IV pilin [Thermoplasmata archaeon]|nr:type IV pilin [Thermoplasmata archaeon]
MSDNSSQCSRRARFAGRARGRWKKRPSRGVSDVVATIILLAMTVVLFSAIFAFVTSFPSPPAQTANQFQASLFFTGNNAAGVNITHLAGPQVAGNGMIYVKSAGGPTQCFSGVPVPVSAGISTPVWNLGETWHMPFASYPGGVCPAGTVDTSKPDNLTIYVFSGSTLLFSVVLPGQPFLSPPTILSTWTAPSPITSGAAFRVYATLAGNLAGHKAFVNLAGITHYGGSTSTVAMWYNSSQLNWQFNVTGPNTSAVTPGTYYGVVNVTGSSGLAASAIVTITVSPSFSATVTPVPSSFKSATPVNFIIALTNFGSTTGTTVNVSLFVNGTTAWTTYATFPLVSNGKGGWWITPTAGATLSAYQTISWSPYLTSPSAASAYTITVSITLKNSIFAPTGYYTFTTTGSIS